MGMIRLRSMRLLCDKTSIDLQFKHGNKFLRAGATRLQLLYNKISVLRRFHVL
jgi:hypothetical protein